MKKFLFILTFAPLFAIAGGGWTLKKGTAYYKVSQWWVVAAQHFSANGGIDDNATTGIYNTSVYAEYGITDRLTGIAYFPVFSRTTRNSQISGTTGMTISEGQALNSLGDADIALKYGLNKPGSKFAYSVTALFGIPLGENAGGRDGSLQTGDGEFNQMLRFDISRSFSLKKINAYASTYVGFNNRTEGFSDEFRFGAELGAQVWKEKLWAIGRMDVVESLKNGLSSAEGSSGTTIFANNTEFVSYTLELAYYATKKVGVSAAFGGAVSGALILAEPSYSVGIFFDLK